MSLYWEVALEFHLRGRLGVVGGGELRHRLVSAEEGGGPEHARKGLELGIIGANRVDVVAPCDRDPVLGALELRLESQEVLVRLEVRVVLAHRKQAAKCARELVLRVLEL